MATFQRPEVQAVIGKDGEHLRGPLLATLNPNARSSNGPAVIPAAPFSSPIMGYLIHATKRITIGKQID
jgi:hypothetical protein